MHVTVLQSAVTWVFELACLASVSTFAHLADLAAAEFSPGGVNCGQPENANPGGNAIAARGGIADAYLGRLLQASHQAMGVCGQV